MDKQFWMAIRQALFMVINAIEEMGQREGWYQAQRTAEIRKRAKLSYSIDDVTSIS